MNNHSTPLFSRLSNVTIFAALVSLLRLTASGQVTDITVLENRLHGGGFQSDVAIDSTGMIVYSAGDVSGVHASTDGGLHYTTKNKGLRSLKAASIAITPDNPSILYVATGDKGNSGALNISLDHGNLWQETAAGDTAMFAGNHSADNDEHLPASHPRSNGNLISIIPGNDPSSAQDDLIVVGTYKDGVLIFSNAGDTLESSIHSAGYVRSVASNINFPNTVYAAIYFTDTSSTGIYEINISTPASPTSSLVYNTAEPEEIVLLDNGHIYAAIGANGIAANTGTGWTTRNTGLITNTNYRWAAIDGYSTSSNDVIYTSVNNSNGASGDNYSSIWRTTNNGTSWDPLVNSNNNVHTSIYNETDTGAETWWFESAFGNAILGRKQTALSSIAIAKSEQPEDPSDDIIYVSGRGGIWKSPNGGNQWWPAVTNLQVTANRSVAVNPNAPEQVAIGNTDFVVMASRDHLSDAVRDKPTSGIERGYDIIFDPISDEVIVAAGDRDNNTQGEIFTKSTNSLGTNANWTALNLANTAASGKIPKAVVSGYHNGTSATSQTIIAAVEGEGVFRYHNGIWTKSTGVSIAGSVRSRLLWPDPQNSGVVYLLDTTAGLYRSLDGGQSWNDMWPGMLFKNNDFFVTGFLAGNSPETLFISAQGTTGSFIGNSFGVYRFNNANTAIFGNPQTDQNIETINQHSGSHNIQRPGPIEMDHSGRLWLTQQSNPPNIHAGFYVMDNPSTDSSFIDLTTAEYQQAAVRPIDIAVSTSGTIYISQDTIGALRLFINPNQDTDNDGATNLEEFTARTDQTDPKSLLHISDINSTPTGLYLTVPTILNQSYILESSDNLNFWSPLQNFNGTNGSVTLVDNTPESANKFYRVRLLQP